MTSIFKMEPMTYRVPTNYFNERSRSGSSPSTFNARVKRKGYESATPVYEQRYVRRGRGGNEGRYLPITTPNVNMKRYSIKDNLIGYDAVAITRVEYKQAPAPANAPATTAAPAPATTTIKQEPVKQAGIGANRGTVGSRGRGNAGVASSAFAGNIGSVNTEVQNDDAIMPYMKENL